MVNINLHVYNFQMKKFIMHLFCCCKILVQKLYTVHKYDTDNKINTITFFFFTNITVWMYISQNLKTTKSLSNQHVININISTYKELNE